MIEFIDKSQTKRWHYFVPDTNGIIYESMFNGQNVWGLEPQAPKLYRK